VGYDASLRDRELVGDRCVAASGGHELEHLGLTCGELGERVIAAGTADHGCDDIAVEDGATGGDPAEIGDEGPDIGDSLLEQVPDPLRPAF
jgi:hypothetical protein